MEFVRTPEEAFAGIKDFPYEPQYLIYNNLRMAYIEEGEGEVVLCLHGEPSWSYLYRKFIPILSPHTRVLAPDLFGFGRSDKPTQMDDYTFGFHYESLKNFVREKELKDITLVCQDWGGLLGLSMVGEHPEWFKRLVIMNTFLPVGKPLPAAFNLWKNFSTSHPNLPIGFVMKSGTYLSSSKTKEVLDAYRAPFPSKKYKAGARKFPSLVPSSPDMDGVVEMKRAREVIKSWEKPALVMFSDKDPIMKGAAPIFRAWIPSVQGKPEITIKDAGHFLQEDKGEEIAGQILNFIQENP
ncbi:MAG: haloalkane dehalogenase [Bacteroidia bacterium]|nr:haloalkane dehalogenase [Bacteroidia bacterium]